MDSVSDGKFGFLFCVLVMEDLFSQSDDVLVVVVEYDVRLLSVSNGYEDDVQGKMIV